jgi:cyclic-di-AMP phosphodiesterase PgpH
MSGERLSGIPPMQNGKDKPSSHPDLRRLLILFLFALTLSLAISVQNPFWFDEYGLGDVVRSTVRATQDVYAPEADVTIKKGEVVVREGERINAGHLQRLSALKNHAGQHFLPLAKFLSLIFIIFISSIVVVEFASRNIKKFALSQKDLIFATALSTFSFLLLRFSAAVFEQFAPHHADNLLYLVPLFFFGMVLRIVLFSEAAIVLTVLFVIPIAFIVEGNISMVLYFFLGNLCAAYFSGKCERRNMILKAGLFTSLIMGLVMFLLTVFMGSSLGDVPLRLVFIFVSGILSSFIAMGLLPIVEYLFDYTTDIKLLELADLEHPLLEEMMINAPGTYHHSIVVGNLSKAAAESIGANPLLARVAAYYHDIGKLKMPHYFIENRKGFEDAHKALSPNMSALIIHSHVKEGAELSERSRLGKKLEDIIRQHHGTSIVSYFYNRAKEREDPALHMIEEKDFRYAGPKPQTKEAGIVMLADAVEAASRTLEEPTPKRIESHVQKIIERIFVDGQLDECELTLKDLYAIEKSFTNILLGIFHHRIEYPEKTATGQNGTDKKLSKTA